MNDKSTTKDPQRVVKLLMPAVYLESLPKEWSKIQEGTDREGLKIDIQGKDLGGYGRRRIVIRAPKNFNAEKNKIVQVRVMQTVNHFEGGRTIAYNYLTLNHVGRTGAKYQLPALSWHVFTTDLALKFGGKLKWISNAYWFQTIDAVNNAEGTYSLGVMAITDENNPFTIVHKDTDEELLFVGGIA